MPLLLTTRWSNPILSMLLWTWGGAVYYLLEVAFKTITGHQERIHWSMLLLAIILSMVLERCGAEFPWDWSLTLQALICTVVITATELVAGLMLNVWLGLRIWDYSNLPMNFMGQICLWYSALWYVLSLVFIPVFDWLRYAVKGGDRPRYSIL